jgi:hypothetical protein
MADEDKRGWITSGFLSKHIDSDKKYNENNYGIGYKSHDGWLGGYYRNSLDKDSLYAGKEFKTDPILGDKLRLAIILGLATGYNKPVTPLALPELLYGNKEHEAALGIVPPLKGITPATLALQYRKRF